LSWWFVIFAILVVNHKPLTGLPFWFWNLPAIMFAISYGFVWITNLVIKEKK